MNQQKKEIEKAHFRKFASNPMMKLEVLTIEDSETPDLVVQMPGKQISVEHTRLIKPQLQETQQHREKIIKQAQKQFESKYEEKLYCLITFNNIALKGGKVEMENYSRHIYEEVEKIYLSHQNIPFHVSLKRGKNWHSEIIEKISVRNTMGSSHWQPFSAYVVDWVDINWLKNIIAIKENNIKKYARSFDENWLLIVGDLGTKASASRFDFIDFSSMQSGFDKVFIYQYRQDEVVVIK